MSIQDIASAIRRVESVLGRRPEAGLHGDAPACASWDGGTRVVTRAADGTQVVTDMPAELGGAGGQFTPGWLLRAALASCATTRIAMAAATEGTVLDVLEARAVSSSDTRGLLGIADAGGQPVPAGPRTLELHIRIAAAGVPPQRLRALVEGSRVCAPVTCAMETPVPVALHLDVADA